MANVIIPWVYKADNDQEFVTGINQEVSAQLTVPVTGSPKIGGRAPVAPDDDALLALPSSVRPRKVQFKAVGHRPRYLVAMEKTAPITSVGTQMDIEDSDGVSATYSARKNLSETFGRHR